ncbi:hypothetical protein WL42_12765 [Burkholderia ubonensis]|nr:hypothetical protein WL42_12765 [Burkholderia ubonensis]
MLMLSTISDAQQNEANLMEQMSTGNRILRASDDPIAAQRLMLIHNQKGDLDQYNENIDLLAIRLEKSEAHFESIDSDITAAQDQVLSAMNAGKTSPDLKAIATSLASLMGTLVSTSNSRDDDGNYLFSGTATDQPTVAYDPNAPVGQRYSFKGNTGKQQAVVGEGVTADGNASLNEMAGLLNQMDKAVDLLNKNPTDPNLQKDLQPCLDALKQTLTSVSAKEGQMGSTRKILDGLKSNHEQVGLADDQVNDALNMADPGMVAVQLNGYRVAAQASMQIYGELSKLSIFNVL